MSIFPRTEFTPLFRLLDDYDAHRNTSNGRGRNSAIRAFQPKFDVREITDAYELQGELPGLNQQDVHIEFNDPHTLVIKGRTEREYSSGTPPNALEGGRITGEEADHHNDQTSAYHKATVEDDGEATESAVATSSGTTSGPKAKYWVTERSVGEFHRSFSFPSRVDQDSVKASLKNGILSVVVPKAKATQSRRINVE